MPDWFKGKPQPEFDIDLPRGKVSEALVEHVVGAKSGVKIEVKTYFHPTVDAFVECYQRRENEDGWRPSGIYTTNSDWWVWVNQNGAAQHWFRVEVLRLAVANSIDSKRRTDGSVGWDRAGLRGDNPTLGFWYPFRYLQLRALDVTRDSTEGGGA